MSKYVFSFLVAVICGLIVFIGGALLVKANSQIAPDHAMLWGFLTAAVLYVLLLPTVFAKIKHICCDLDWADECSKLYHRIPDYYRQSFWWLFLFINLAFCFIPSILCGGMKIGQLYARRLIMEKESHKGLFRFIGCRNCCLMVKYCRWQIIFGDLPG
ncbi:MAG: hypothetical protein J6W96_04620 [Alphaproteobacteria bacterium]|nr:hypothetical protein [Alphaproteobacteria bacterium]